MLKNNEIPPVGFSHVVNTVGKNRWLEPQDMHNGYKISEIQELKNSWFFLTLVKKERGVHDRNGSL